jgi:hypothetical protein
MQEIRFDKLKIQAFSILRRSHYKEKVVGAAFLGYCIRASIDSPGASGDAKTLVPSWLLLAMLHPR